jgi:hypothetical protein
MPIDTSPLVAQIKDLGFASGYWDLRGKVDFGAGTVSSFLDSRTALTTGGSYFGDQLSELLSVNFYVINESQGFAVDRFVIRLGPDGTSSFDNTSPAGAITDNAPSLWNGDPGLTSSLIFEGGVLSSPSVDENFGFGTILDSNGANYFIGRTGFQAIGIKA